MLTSDISEADWKAIQETLYLMSIPGMAESIIAGGSTPLEGGHGSNQYMQNTNNSVSAKMTQKQLAEQMGMSVDTLQNYKIQKTISSTVFF